MRRIYLSDTEKKVLKALNKSQDIDYLCSVLSKEEIYAATSSLKEIGFIDVRYREDHELAGARILEKGIAYLKENPALENPVDENEFKMLQMDDLEHRKKIRRKESIIRNWQIATAISGLIGLLLGWFASMYKLLAALWQ
jgi:DNA-binding PadR family transcriptional regulator